METETGSEAAKPKSNLRKVLSMKDIVDGNMSHDTESTAVTPYEGDAAITAAMLKYSAEEQANIANAVRMAVSNIDMSTIHDYADVITQMRNSASAAIEEINSFPYLSEPRQIPTNFYSSPFIETAESFLEPIPDGGIECFKFYATGGTAIQAGIVLGDEFYDLKSPVCYLQPHQVNLYHWHICLFHGTEKEAKEWHLARENVDFQGDSRTTKARIDRIGYVYISDRPKIQIAFYVFDEAHKDLVTALGHRAANELEQSGFDLFAAVIDENSLPEGAAIIDKFDEILFRATTDELANLVRAYLQTEGHVTDSVSLERKIYNKQIFIQYPFNDCIIRLKTKSEKFGETYIKPDIHCWEPKPIEREKKLINAQQHVVVLLEALKYKIRWSPQKPKSLDDWDAWFDYLHDCEKAGINYDLQNLAKDISKSYGYVRQKHAEYLAGKES